MAEGPHPPSQSSHNIPSCQDTEEPAIIEPDVACGHCKKELNNPYLLCCLHSVCAECLPNMVVENVRLKCSQCGDTSTAWNDRMSESVRFFPVPNSPLARYIEGMKIVRKVTSNAPIPCGSKRCRSGDSPSTVYCTDCSKFLCERCYDAHELSDAYEGHVVKTLEEVRTLGPQDLQVLTSQNATPIVCQHHKGKVLEYSCEHCDLLMCQACAIDLKPPHNPKHISSSQSDIASCNIRLIKSTYQAAVHFEKKCERMENDLQPKLSTLERVKEASLLDIDKAFQGVYQAVEKRKEDLRRQVVTSVEEKKDVIVSQLTNVQQEKEKSQHTQSSLQFLLSSGSSHDIIASKDVVRTHQSVLTSKWCQEELESTVSQVVTFDHTNQDALLKAIGDFGVVESGACPANCTVEPKPESVQWNGSDPVTLTVTTFDRENIRCKRGGDNVEAFLHPKSPIPGPAIKARVVDDKNGRYTTSFPTTYRGECDLYIRVNRRDIRGSPFGVQYLLGQGLLKLSRNAEEIGMSMGYLNYPEHAGNPWGIAVDVKGTTFIADFDEHQIHVFDVQRRHMKSFGHKGTANGCLNNPIGLAIDDDGLLYIGNYGNNRVEVLTKDGAFVRCIGAGRLQKPYGVVIRARQAYVANAEKQEICIFTLHGELIQAIGQCGSGPGQFSRPTAVSIAHNGDIYVIDGLNGCVQVFCPSGLYQTEFGKDMLSSSYASTIICIDEHVLVGDQNYQHIYVFSTTGKFLHRFAVDGHPCSFGISFHGELLVSLHDKRKIVVY